LARGTAEAQLGDGGVTLGLDGQERLARDLDRGKLKRITYTIPFDKVIDTAGEILAGKIRGRVVVEIG